MSDDFEQKLVERKELEARATFSAYVQSTGFQMSLSRNMIDMLGLLRDSEQISKALAARRARGRDHLWSNSVPLLNALARRGLVLHNPFDGRTDEAPAGWGWWRLTRAGEITCMLLVEAGILADAPSCAPRGEELG